MNGALILRKRTVLAILVMLLLAVALRVIYISQLKSNPFFNYPVVDSKVYHDMAVKLAAGESPTQEAFYQPPLYIYFLGFLYRWFGTDLFLIRLLQLMLGVVNIGLTFLLAKRFFSVNGAILCGIILSFYGPLLFFDAELLAPVLIIFLNLLMLLAMYSFLDSPSRLRASLCGVLLGLSAITMAVILPFAVIALVYGYFYLRGHLDHTSAFQQKEKPEGIPRKNMKKKGQAGKHLNGKSPSSPKTVSQYIAFSLLFLLGIAAVILPVTWYNWKNSHDLVLISSNAGINFYLGTGRSFEQKVAIRPGYQWKDLMSEPLAAGYQKPSQQSRYFMKKSIGLIFQDPLGFLLGTVKKMMLFANGNEIMRNQEIYPFRHYSSLLSLLVWKHGIAFPFGLLFPLALLGGIVSLVQKERRYYLLVLLVASHILVTVLFFVSARYRMNILPFLVILAVFGARSLGIFWRGRIWKKAFMATGGLLLLLVLCNINVGSMPRSFNADAYFNLGVAYMQEGRPEAKTMFQKAIEDDPGFLDAWGNLGILQDIEGDHHGAVKCFTIILNQYPDDIEANSQMGNAYYNLGQLEKAKDQFIKVLTLDKDNKEAIYNLPIIQNQLQLRQNNGPVVVK